MNRSDSRSGSAGTARKANLDPCDDDWETSPDFNKDMNEMHQRWGPQRSIGSINMSKLIHEVHEDHKSIMRERYTHSSQSTDRSSSRTTTKTSTINSARPDEVIRNESKVSDMKRNLFDRFTDNNDKPKPANTRPQYVRGEELFKQNLDNRPVSQNTYQSSSNKSTTRQHKIVQESTDSSPVKDSQTKAKEIVIEKKDYVSKPPRDIRPNADAYKREQDKIFSQIDKETSHIKDANSYSRNIKNSSPDIAYVDDEPKSSKTTPRYDTNSSGTGQRTHVGDSIKSVRDKFDSLLREDEYEFRKRAEERKKEFFNEIRSQVLETRRGLDGFDDDFPSEDLEEKSRRFMEHAKRTTFGGSPLRQATGSPTNQTSSKKILNETRAPRVFSETHCEEVVSKIVKENDKIITNEKKRNVETTRSCHGSSDEDDKNNKESYRPKTTKSPTKYHDIVSEKRNPVSTKASWSNTPSPSSPVRRQASKQTIIGGGLMARTLFDYVPDEPDELSFDVDELITNIEKIHVNWYRGTITLKDGTKRTGLFPANHVKLLNDTDEY